MELHMQDGMESPSEALTVCDAIDVCCLAVGITVNLTGRGNDSDALDAATSNTSDPSSVSCGSQAGSLSDDIPVPVLPTESGDKSSSKPHTVPEDHADHIPNSRGAFRFSGLRP
ncbi:hypothetical protein OE88DRAFT_1668692 [Heliocybe sulcata]|uniref:Uncharacterized protein n=1 Tax=Heliocybe sulcata TaxID=5364 RepID=A0A5C3MP58_9AGAM|nr:hypothetical protein OE88DRAFT_1668692 [Heliocybe sulcata]